MKRKQKFKNELLFFNLNKKNYFCDVKQKDNFIYKIINGSKNA